MSKISIIAKNSSYLYLRMLVVLGANLYAVRVVLDALGVSDFGIYGLAGGIVALFAFLNATMTRAAQRFLGVEIGRGDASALNRMFNAVLATNAVIAALVVISSLTVGLWLINHELNIPKDRLAAANVVFLYSIATTVAMILRTPYSALIISRQKMWFFSITSIAEAVFKICAALLVARSTQDRLSLYALLLCLVSFALLIWYVWFCRKQFPESKVILHHDPAQYKTLLAFTSLSFIGNLAHILRTQGVNLLLNIFFGTPLNATYGVMAQAQGAATQFTSSFELALSPQIYEQYGRGDLQNVQALVFAGTKISFFLFSLLVWPALFGMDFALELWLGTKLNYLSLFVSWMLIAHLVETISKPLDVAAFATGNIRRYQLVVAGILLLNLPLTWLAFHLSENPAAFLYVAFIIQLASFSTRVWFMHGLIDLDMGRFLRTVIMPVLFISCIGALLTYVLTLSLGTPETFVTLIGGSLAIATPLALASIFIGLNAQERELLIGKVLRKLRKRTS